MSEITQDDISKLRKNIADNNLANINEVALNAPVATRAEKIETLKRNADALFWKLMDHARRQYIAWALAALSMFLFSSNYQLGWNRTDSLPYSLFLIHKGEAVKKGDIVAFAWDGGGKYAWMSPFKTGSTMVKYVLGVPGDHIRADADGEYLINDVPHAHTKKFTKTGKPLTPLLQPGSTMKIGENRFYVGTPHKDGFDSRYEMVGLLESSRFIGKVYVVF